MANNARGIHVSPGVYTKETELTYAVKSLGITTLGLVGETQKGPAFEPISIENWREFQDVFGGTSTEKFKDSQYPKYELPYIAKSYLTESNQLEVCRVLGLSGYNAGPAWVIKSDKNDPIAVLRSRGHYEKFYRYTSVNENGSACECNGGVEYDALVYEVGEKSHEKCDELTQYDADAVKLLPYEDFDVNGNLCEGFSFTKESPSGGEFFPTSPTNYGRFRISGYTSDREDFSYAVSLNPLDKDYILKVLGSTPTDGETPLYVEALYDVSLQQLINANEISGISTTLEAYMPYHIGEYCVLDSVSDFLTIPETSLTRKQLGQRFLSSVKDFTTVHTLDYSANTITDGNADVDTLTKTEVGQIYTVKQFTKADGKRHYYYTHVDEATISSGVSLTEKLLALDKIETMVSGTSAYPQSIIVKVSSDGRYWKMQDSQTRGADDKVVAPVTLDMNDYKEQYRFASTPWFVSNIKGDANHIEMNRLFRFHTITDGNVANNEIKISIANVDYDNNQFDVYVRAINDTDYSPVILEKFVRCNLIPTDKNFIGFRIGTFDGTYEIKSKYITVELNDTLASQHSVPCGFLGYPLTQFSGATIANENHNLMKNVSIKYNRDFDIEKKIRKQYFGLSDLVGVDLDMFTYKGKTAYSEHPDYLSHGFHLDSRLDFSGYAQGDYPFVTVDGVSGYQFDSVSINARTDSFDGTPIIGHEEDMEESIYNNINVRKFTAYFFGGFDGWDEYRQARTNTDDYSVTRYKGEINTTNGIGYSFDVLENPESFNLNGKVITSDYYAYLGAIRQFANPELVDINVFATPGIDLINNKLLSQEVIDMIEEERADSIYVATLPDKPYGAFDYVDEMYSADDIVAELDDTEIDSNYTCTYFPWVKYQDKDNNQYLMLPPTKDVVRNMAMTDNTTQPWFAPAGLSRGSVDCIRAHSVTKLADEDTLYEGRINPIKTFAKDGVKIWGQKNLQIEETQLNRIAVRRLLLRMRKLISIACLNLIFDPNDATTKNKFLSLVTPIMDNIKANRGVSDYRIEVNDTLESRQRRELPAKIYFKPVNCLEWIDLDFIVTPEAVEFDNI